VGFLLLVGLQWYWGRHYATPRLDLPQTLVAMIVGSLLLLAGGWAWDQWQARRKPGLTADGPDV
jgi:hypothetical protein